MSFNFGSTPLAYAGEALIAIPAIVANDDLRNAPRPNSLDTFELPLHFGPPRENASDATKMTKMKTTDFNEYMFSRLYYYIYILVGNERWDELTLLF